MADIHYTISLGIGAPSGIPEFLLFGLQTAPEPALTSEGLEYTLPANRMHYAVGANRLHYSLPVNRLHYTLPEED